ncbi:uncharacterized protein SPAPADRAFT_143909 [Spathaspora passalidarum NRRL Y-27907]|uniref:Uncharacterized protein n=1 Tax=Spathaspora passalidarum (strain NRRL Y-27907 / 11-Y1) TaxID=619300 RepID=G3AUW2_SPAPN|nr:uncharacterized protein SPAPADRAFT_143909 [Spathaspora passalidarum NRRL Y-27907]EGW30053.1 hypothetical protein SPAPADRAFT_143909 [Spathaspora passalidarum NRRL Y-27907]
MEKPISDLPPTKNRYIQVLDLYLSNIIHNPIFTSVAVLISFCYLQCKQWDWLMISSHSFEFIFVEDYEFDILSNIINLIFIFRFVYYIKLNLIGEIALFLVQNFACYKYVLMKDGISFFKDTDMSMFLKSCIALQVIFPWLILLSCIVQRMPWNKTLVDCNTNYLPLFMSQSFMFVNTTFPLLDNSFKNYELLYKLACFSLKFYLVFQFVLYEFVLINYEHEDVVDYSVYYREVSCFNEKGRQGKSNFNLVKKYAMTVVCLFIIVIDLGFIGAVHKNVYNML